MFKNYFVGIKGIEIYPVFLLILFIAFFVSMTVWLMRAEKKEMDELSKIPLENESGQSLDS
jgi:cbb3-type cytochrome oxidase subunit 3